MTLASAASACVVPLLLITYLNPLQVNAPAVMSSRARIPASNGMLDFIENPSKLREPDAGFVCSAGPPITKTITNVDLPVAVAASRANIK